jgi:hypothetical protein
MVDIEKLLKNGKYVIANEVKQSHDLINIKEIAASLRSSQRLEGEFFKGLDTAPPSQLHEGGFKAFITGCTIINDVRQIKIDASLHRIFTAFFGGISAVQSCSKKYIFGYKNAIYQELYFDISMGIEIYKQPVIIAIPDHTSNWINKCFAFNVASKSS